MWGHPQGDTQQSYFAHHLLGFLVQGEDNKGRCTNNLAGRHPIQTNGAPTSIIPTIFMPDALPTATLPIYPGMGQPPSVLAYTKCLDFVHTLEKKLGFKVSC